ncbi:MAG: FKBP-type peptidyl-prolyl cis-trans isomerase [Ferruginibacter sp.]
MIRRLLTFFSFCVILSSCKKNDDNGCPYTVSGVVVPASEMTSLQAYITANRPAAIQHPGGFFYEINAAGTGTVTPEVCSNVTVKYAGYLTNGFKFTSAAEENTGAVYALGALIVGWQRGLPLIKAGGSINLYLPPSLGYGSNAVGSIPPNSILIFVIQLTAVQ